MVPDSMMKGIVASYLASPQGMKMIHAYLSPADGQTSIRKYLATPEGKQTVQLLLPPMLDGFNLLEDVKEKIRIANSEKT